MPQTIQSFRKEGSSHFWCGKVNARCNALVKGTMRIKHKSPECIIHCRSKMFTVCNSSKWSEKSCRWFLFESSFFYTTPTPMTNQVKVTTVMAKVPNRKRTVWASTEVPAALQPVHCHSDLGVYGCGEYIANWKVLATPK